jgi:hypothetical protein
MSMDILPLGELRISFRVSGLVCGDRDGQPDVTRIHPKRPYAKGPSALSVIYFPFSQTTPRRSNTPAPAAVESG